MRVRGQRRCRECGTEWSYFDTGEVTCPACGSLRSRGIDETRELHTDSPAELDLSEPRSLVADRPVREVADAAADAARSYLVRRGFIDGGDLLALDDRYLRAARLRQVAADLRHALQAEVAAEEHFLALLSADEDPPETVPPSLRAAHGLAAAEAVDAYLSDIRRWLDEHPDERARDRLEQLREQVRRVHALDGDVPVAEADRLVDATRAVGDYLRTGDVGELALAAELIDRFP